VHNYLQLLSKILEHGDPRQDRTGVGTIALFGELLEWDLQEGFPLVTTKKVNFDAVKAELLWFLTGSQDVNELRKMGCKIWDQNAESPYWKPKATFPGDLGRIYGVQWRSWRTYVDKAHGYEWGGFTTVDQIAELVSNIKSNPADRRHIVSAWNPGELGDMALPPCHMMFQCFVRKKEFLDLQMYQRSCDVFLGVPFNISSYALLCSMLAQVTGYKPGMLKILFGDVHIYNNHIEQVKTQLERKPLALPKLWLSPNITDINKFQMSDIAVDGYCNHAAIKAEMAV
jgi:thymidylate synthase